MNKNGGRREEEEERRRRRRRRKEEEDQREEEVDPAGDGKRGRRLPRKETESEGKIDNLAVQTGTNGRGNVFQICFPPFSTVIHPSSLRDKNKI